MRLLFDDGVVRDIEYVPGQAAGSMIRPLDDPAYFAQVRVDPEARTVTWPNGLDLAPEVLHGDYEPVNDCGFRTVLEPEIRRGSGRRLARRQRHEARPDR